MGISGLHPVLRPYLRETHISGFRGRRIGCDAFAWLHRGACACAADIASSNRTGPQPNNPKPWLEFCLNMIRMLLANGTTPVVGALCPKCDSDSPP